MLPSALFYAAICAGFFVLSSRRWFVDRNIRTADARSVALIRIVTATIMFAFVIWENYPSIARIPLALRTSTGLVGLCPIKSPLCQTLYDRSFLTGVHMLTLLALAMTALGWKSRGSAAVAAIGCLLLGGIARQFTNYYHTGMIPMYLLFVLPLTPCGDAWSIDARKRSGRGFRSAENYGWARFALWSVIALLYVNAGLSKFATGTLDWFHPDNIRRHIVTDCIQQKGWNFNGGLLLVEASDRFVTIFAAAGVAVELAAVLLLFSRIARFVLPWVLLVFHLTIFYFQNVPFFEMMVLPFVFLEGTKRPTVAANESERTGGENLLSSKALALGVLLTMLALWIHRAEFYPGTGYRMYSSVKIPETLNAETYLPVTVDGTPSRFTFEELVTIFHRGQHRSFLQKQAFNPKNRPEVARFLRECRDEWNTRVPESEQLKGFVFERRAWDFRKNPKDSAFGPVTERAEFLFDEKSSPDK